MDTPFTCYFDLHTPVILGRRLTLDGLLAGILFARLQDLEQALSEIPLKKTGGVFHASTAVLEGKTTMRGQTVGSSLQVNRLDPEIIKPKKNGSYPTVSLKNGEFRNRQTHYMRTAANSVFFCGVGDPDKVEALIKEVDGLGAKRSSGWGQVNAASVDEVETDDPYFGLRFSDGSPARPIPWDQWAPLGSGGAIQGFERYAPPYHYGDAVLCALPPPRPDLLTKAAVNELFGVTNDF